MNEIILDGEKLADRRTMHDELIGKLGLTEPYGRNLDALNDKLGEMVEKPSIRIENAKALLESITLIRVLRDNGIDITFD